MIKKYLAFMLFVLNLFVFFFVLPEAISAKNDYSIIATVLLYPIFLLLTYKAEIYLLKKEKSCEEN